MDNSRSSSKNNVGFQYKRAITLSKEVIVKKYSSHSKKSSLSLGHTSTTEKKDDEKQSSSDSISSPQRVVTTDVSKSFIPLFFASERGCLGIWEKHTGQGYVKRRTEITPTRRFLVLELISATSHTGTYILAPHPQFAALHITLPNLIMIMKHFRKTFAFEVQIIDNYGYTRRLNFNTTHNPASLRRWPFLCQVPLQLDVGWNEIQVDLSSLVESCFRTKYVETTRVVIYANCRIRQVFFCDEAIAQGDVPVPSMRLFHNVRLHSADFGPFNHPDYTESGPMRTKDSHYTEPPVEAPLTRVEKDLKDLHLQRFNELSGRKLSEPYRSYFTELVNSKGATSSAINFPSTTPIEHILRINDKTRSAIDHSKSMPKSNAPSTSPTASTSTNNNNNNHTSTKSEVLKSISLLRPVSAENSRGEIKSLTASLSPSKKGSVTLNELFDNAIKSVRKQKMKFSDDIEDIQI